MRPPLGSSARTLFAGPNVQCDEFHIAAAAAAATATTIAAGGESTRGSGITRSHRNAYRIVTTPQLLPMASRYLSGICYQLDTLGGDEQIRATERGVIPYCTQKKRRSDAVGPALCYLVVNRRSPSEVLHHLLVSGCIVPRPPARWDPSLITIPSSCSIPAPRATRDVVCSRIWICRSLPAHHYGTGV